MPTFARLAAHDRVQLLEVADGSVDEEYRYYLCLKPGWRIAGYGGRGKHVRNLKEAKHMINTAEACEPGMEG